jgi:hypothetical protein
MPKTRKRPPESATAKLVAVGLGAAVFSSALTAWVVLKFVAPPPLSEATKPAVVSARAADFPIERPQPELSDQAWRETEGTNAGFITAGGESNLQSGGPGYTHTGNPAADSYNLVAVLKGEYNKGFFAGRFGVMNDLDAVQAAADRLQQTQAAGGANAETISQNTQALVAVLDRTITRLDGLAKSAKKADQEASARLLLEQMSAIRATLPGN